METCNEVTKRYVSSRGWVETNPIRQEKGSKKPKERNSVLIELKEKTGGKLCEKGGVSLKEGRF